jgi:hypothetical protein
MAISQNPELTIDVKYNTSKTDATFLRLTRKVEDGAEKHERNLRQIKESGDAKIQSTINSNNAKRIADEQKYVDKLRRIQETADQQSLVRLKATQKQHLDNTKNWVTKMESYFSNIGALAYTYLGAKLVGAIGGYFNSALDNLDDLRKEASQLQVTFQDLYATVMENSLAGVPQTQTIKFFNMLRQKMDSAKDGSKKDIEELKGVGITLDMSAKQAYDTMVKFVKKTGDASLFGGKIAGEFRKITKVTDAQLEKSKQRLKQIGITDADIAYIEKYNDAIETFNATMQLVIGKTFAQSGDKIADIITEISDRVAEIDTEKLSRFFIFLVDATTTIASNIESLSRIGFVASKINLIGAAVRQFSELKQLGPLEDNINTLENLIDKYGREIKDFDLIQAEAAEGFNPTKGLDETIDALVDARGKLVKAQVELQSKSTTRLQSTITEFSNSGASKFFKNMFKLVEDFFTKKIPEYMKIFNSKVTEAEPVLGRMFGSLGTKVGVFGKGVGEAGIKIGGWAGKIFKAVDGVTGLVTGFAKLAKGLGKISVYLTALFVIYDFVDALTTYLDKATTWMERLWAIVKAIGYAAAKFVADIVDLFLMIVTLGASKNWLGNIIRDFFGLNDELDQTSKKLLKIQQTMNNGKNWWQIFPYALKPDINKNNNDGDEDDKKEETLADRLRHQADEFNKNRDDLKAMRSELERLEKEYIKAGKSADFFTFKLIDMSLDENKVKKANLIPGTLELNQIQIGNSVWNMNEIPDYQIPVKPVVVAPDFIQELEKTAQYIKDNFEPVITGVFDFMNTVQQANIDNLYNQLDIMQRRIDLEQQYWDTVLQNLEDVGARDTAYYVKQEHEKERSLEKFAAQELELKAKVWEAEKSARISGAIMTAAQASLAAWTIIPPQPWLSAALSTMIAGTLAVQLSSIGSQQNPYTVKKNLGGWINGSGYTDSVPASLTPGEFVVNRSAAKENAALLENINSGRNTSTGSMVVVNLKIDGNVISDDAWIEDKLIPGLNRAVSNGYRLNLN